MILYGKKLHQNLFITQSLGSKTKTVLAKQTCCIQTKMYGLYRKMTINGHFSIWSIYFWWDDIKMYQLYRKMTINGHFSIYVIHFCLDKTVLGSIFEPSCNKLSYKEVVVLIKFGCHCIRTGNFFFTKKAFIFYFSIEKYIVGTH